MQVKLEFKPQDCWIGVFWKDSEDMWEMWVCIVPMFPIHFTRIKRIWHRGIDLAKGESYTAGYFFDRLGPLCGKYEPEGMICKRCGVVSTWQPNMSLAYWLNCICLNCHARDN